MDLTNLEKAQRAYHSLRALHGESVRLVAEYMPLEMRVRYEDFLGRPYSYDIIEDELTRYWIHLPIGTVKFPVDYTNHNEKEEVMKIVRILERYGEEILDL